MNNPINNTIFDSRDLIEYIEYLAQSLVDEWNGNNEIQVTEISEILEYDFQQAQMLAWEAFADDNESEIDEYNNLINFASEIENNNSEYSDGMGIIHEDEFTDYVKEMLEDCGYISQDFPSWITIDWEDTADNVKQDYSSVDYNGDTYYFRS